VLAFEAGRKKRIRVNTISAGIDGLSQLALCFKLRLNKASHPYN